MFHTITIKNISNCFGNLIVIELIDVLTEHDMTIFPDFIEVTYACLPTV